MEDTIAAISTGNGISGISIIRISGKKARNIIEKVFDNHEKTGHGKIVYGHIINKTTKQVIDEALVSTFVAPKSFTGEDVCEINMHGGKKITQLVLELVLNNGARLATAGEFSKRAFVNGKMDLSKAEAISDMLVAVTAAQTKIAAGNIEGKTKNKILEIKDKIVNVLAEIEVNIDYPEYVTDENEKTSTSETIENTKKQIEELIETYERTKYVKNGINVAILGATNTGKSSLLNRLTNSERAIVTDVEGTTRDIVSDTIIYKGMAINIFDSAGIRETTDTVEKIGIKKSMELLEKAEYVIYLLDATKKITERDIDIIKTLTANKKQHTVCINKIDLIVSHEKRKYEKEVRLPSELLKENVIYISAETGEGIEELLDAVVNTFNEGMSDVEEKTVVNERQRGLLKKASKALDEAVEEINAGRPIDIVAIKLNEALSALKEITGEETSDEVIKKIFERFCLGK